MKSWEFGRCALNMGAAAALLAGCGESQPPLATSGERLQLDGHGTKTFSYSGAEQHFKVPRGVTQLKVVASGASGPTASSSGCGYEGGSGGLVKATIPVTPGEKLAVVVGGEGDSGSACGTSGKGGFNGGGNGGEGVSASNGTGGGGASDVREGGDTLLNRILVAGGGGGGGENLSYGAGRGGAGGRRVGGHGGSGYRCSSDGHGGRGGTQIAGGRGGRGGRITCGDYTRAAHGYPGGSGIGGDGGAGYYSGGGGGGGGGYYGGGGGGTGAENTFGSGGGGGGGGGSSLFESSATHVNSFRGKAPPGNGQITISW